MAYEIESLQQQKTYPTCRVRVNSGTVPARSGYTFLTTRQPICSSTRNSAPYRFLAVFLSSCPMNAGGTQDKNSSRIRSFAKKGIRRISPSCIEANAKIHPVNNAEERGTVKRRIHFLHHSPGRVRIQVDGLKGNAQLGEAIHSLTNKVQGIQRISASTITGSVLIFYDKSAPHVLQYLKSMVNEAETLLDMRITDPAAFAKLLGA